MSSVGSRGKAYPASPTVGYNDYFPVQKKTGSGYENQTSPTALPTLASKNTAGGLGVQQPKVLKKNVLYYKIVKDFQQA